MSDEYVTREEFDKKIAEFRGGAIADHGTIEILCGYIHFKLEKDDFSKFLHVVRDSGKFSADAQIVANKFLDLDSVFGEHNYKPGQVEQ